LHEHFPRAANVASHGQHIEGIELHFIVVLARMQRIEIGDPSTPKITASPSITKYFSRFFSADPDPLFATILISGS
jgi:hypothetical protein